MELRRLLSVLMLTTFLAATACAQWMESQDSLMSDIRAIASNGTYLFAGAFAGVYVSADNGYSWSPVLRTTDVRCLAVIGSDVYAAIYGYGVFRSTDNGANWVERDSGLANHNLNSLIAYGGELFAGSNGCVQRSTDGGGYWEPSAASISGADIHALSFAGLKLFAGSWSNGAYCSTDEGTTWAPTGNSLTASVGSLRPLGSNLFAATSAGVFRTTDDGQNWTLVNNGMTGISTNSLETTGGTLFAGSFGGGIYRSTDEGATWTAVNAGLKYFNITCLTINGGYIYAGTGGTRASIWRRPLSEVASVDRSLSATVHSFSLGQNYPNPFNPTTTIAYTVGRVGSQGSGVSMVHLAVYDLLGREVSVLVNERKNAGSYEVKFDGSNLASGVYFYSIRAGDFTQTKRLLLLK